MIFINIEHIFEGLKAVFCFEMLDLCYGDHAYDRCEKITIAMLDEISF
jgi:hypothetical protein